MFIFFLVALETKKLNLHLSDIRKQLLRAALEKSFLLARFVHKTSVKGSYFCKNASFFPATLAKMNTVTGIFQGFYPDFKQFCIVCNISRRLSNNRFRKF